MSKKTPETSTPVIEPVAPDAVPHTPVPGRRSRMNPRVFERVLKALAQGGVTLDALLRQDGMPARSSFYRWLDKHPAQWSRLARAREIGDDLSLDQARAIADASTPTTVQQDRLRVDARVRIAQVRRNRPAAAQQNVMVNLGHANTVDELAPGQGWRRKPRDQWDAAERIEAAKELNFVLESLAHMLVDDLGMPPIVGDGLRAILQRSLDEINGTAPPLPAALPAPSTASRPHVVDTAPSSPQSPNPGTQYRSYAEERIAQQTRDRDVWEEQQFGRPLTDDERTERQRADAKINRAADRAIARAPGALPEVIGSGRTPLSWRLRGR